MRMRTLPPRVTGSPRAVLEVGVTDVALLNEPPGCGVLVHWWGSDSPQFVVGPGETGGSSKYQVRDVCHLLSCIVKSDFIHLRL